MGHRQTKPKTSGHWGGTPDVPSPHLGTPPPTHRVKGWNRQRSVVVCECPPKNPTSLCPRVVYFEAAVCGGPPRNPAISRPDIVFFGVAAGEGLPLKKAGFVAAREGPPLRKIRFTARTLAISGRPFPVARPEERRFSRLLFSISRGPVVRANRPLFGGGRL